MPAHLPIILHARTPRFMWTACIALIALLTMLHSWERMALSFAAVGALLQFGPWFKRLVLLEQGFRVQTLFSSHFVAWSDTENFALEKSRHGHADCLIWRDSDSFRAWQGKEPAQECAPDYDHRIAGAWAGQSPQQLADLMNELRQKSREAYMSPFPKIPVWEQSARFFVPPSSSH